MLPRGRGGPVTVFSGRGIRSCPPPKQRHVERARTDAQAAQEAFERAEEAFARSRGQGGTRAGSLSLARGSSPRE